MEEKQMTKIHTKLKHKGKIYYRCNMAVKASLSNCTYDTEKVTCENCLRTVPDYIKSTWNKK